MPQVVGGQLGFPARADAGLRAGHHRGVVDQQVDRASGVHQTLRRGAHARQVAEVTLPANAFTSGSSTVVLDTTRSSFARVQVVSAGGQVVAFSNPVWLLQGTPPVPVPSARRAADSTG